MIIYKDLRPKIILGQVYLPGTYYLNFSFKPKQKKSIWVRAEERDKTKRYYQYHKYTLFKELKIEKCREWFKAIKDSHIFYNHDNNTWTNQYPDFPDYSTFSPAQICEMYEQGMDIT